MTNKYFLIPSIFLFSLFQIYNSDPLYNWNSTTMKNKNWMQSLDSGVPIRQMSIIGTHNSVVFDSCQNINGFNQQCQGSSLTIQLESGIRAIDIHVKHFNNTFQIYDRECIQSTKFSSVLNTLKNFLSAQPTQTIIIRIVQQISSEICSRSFEETFISYRDAFPGLFWTPTTQNPDLGQVRGKVVLLQDFTSGISHGLQMNSFSVLPHKYLSSSFELYSKWEEIKNFLPVANSEKKSIIMFWTGHGGTYPYFVASGKSSPTGGKLSTGFTTPGFASTYPDFPRINCFIGICSIAFEGMNILGNNFIVNNGLTFTGILYVNFYGDDLATMVIGKSTANFAKCTAQQVTQGCTLCSIDVGFPCLKCNTTLNYIYDTANKICLAKVGYYLDSNYFPRSCSTAQPGCLECLSASNCTTCDLSENYILQYDQCIAAPGYYLDPNYLPTPCPQVGCIECKTPTVCTKCSLVLNYFLNTTTASCNLCNPIGFYVDLISESCIPCSFPCTSCTVQPTKCTNCPSNQLYYLDQITWSCNFCNQRISNCLKCDLAGAICYQCKATHELINGICTLPGCQTLSPYEPKCISCFSNYHFVFQPKTKNCQCAYGYYPEKSSGFTQCLPKCGDGILVLPYQECDDGNQRYQDGCSETCKKQQGFYCSQDSPSQCHFQYSPRLFQYNYVYRYQGKNKCQFSLTLSPFHQTFKYINWFEYITLNISDDLILKNYTKFEYNQLTNQIAIDIEYLKTLEEVMIQFTLSSNQTVRRVLQSSLKEQQSRNFINLQEQQDITRFVSRALKSSDVQLKLTSASSIIVKLQGTNSKLLFEPQFILIAYQGAQTSSLIITILILFQFLVGSYFHKMIGIETIQILQFFYFVRIIIEQNQTSILNSMNIFKYSAYGGYSNYEVLLGETSQSTESLTYMTVNKKFVTVGLTKFFFTNVNFPLFVATVSLIGFLFTLIRKHAKRNQYLSTFNQLHKDQYSVLRRSSQWVYDHFVFPYINVFSMVILFSTILYLNFKPNNSSVQLQNSPIIEMIERTSFLPHLLILFITLLIYCSEIFISLEQFRHSRLTQSQKARVPKSTYQKLEHDENNPDCCNYKPGYILFYLFFNLIVGFATVFDIFFEATKDYLMEILLVICTMYWIFVWKWKPYNHAVDFHNKVLRLNHLVAVLFMLMNVILKRLSLNLVINVVFVYVMLLMLFLVGICGYLRIAVEYRFRRKLLSDPTLMQENIVKKDTIITHAEKMKALLRNNPYLLQNQIKQMFKKKGKEISKDLTSEQINEAWFQIRRQIYSDIRRMKEIRKQIFYPPRQTFFGLNSMITD